MVERTAGCMYVESFKTKSGDTVHLDELTVFVGPNNTGKSQTLSDIRNVADMRRDKGGVILSDLSTRSPESYDELMKNIVRKERNGVKRLFGLSAELSGQNRADRGRTVDQIFNNDKDRAVRELATWQIFHLTTQSRFSSLETTEQKNLEMSSPENLIQELYTREKEAEDSLRGTFESTFERDLKLDYSRGQFSLKVGQEKGQFNDAPADPRELAKVLSDCNPITDEGDGYIGYVSVVLALILSRNRLTMLDEPDAFLHPAQARELGAWIAENGNAPADQVLVSTHNSSFISGLLSSDQNVTIYRLNRAQNRTTYGKLSSNLTQKLSQDALLSSQRVIEAIFHEGVVICEADSDRTVYQAVASNELEAPDLLFVHAHNKQSIRFIAGVLIEAEIPFKAIVDIDLLRDEGDLRRLLESINGSNIEKFVRNSNKIDKCISKSNGWKEVKQQGVDSIPESKRDLAREVISGLRTQNIFVVQAGELQSWMDLGTSRSSEWTIRALEEIHDNKSEQNMEELIDFVEEVHASLRRDYTQAVS